MPKPATKPTVTMESLNRDRVRDSGAHREGLRSVRLFPWSQPSASRSVPTSTARSARSSSQSIRGSARVRLRGQVAETCREQLQPSSLSGFRTGELGAYGGEGWSDDRCHQHRDHHHHRRNNRCARDHLLRPERIASVAASTGSRLAPRAWLGAAQYAPIRSARSESGASGRRVEGCEGEGPKFATPLRPGRSSIRRLLHERG
jgi:hypothetical protein